MNRFLSLVFIAAVVLASCGKKTPNHAKYIPKDANNVVCIDLKSISDKLEKDSLTVETLLETAKSVADKNVYDEIIKKFNELRNAGIDWTDKIFISTSSFNVWAYGSQPAIEIVASLSDSKKLEDFLKKQSGVEIKKGEDFSFIRKNDMAIGWNDKAIIFVTAEKKKTYDDYLSDSSANAKPRSENNSTDIQDNLKKYFSQKKSESILSADGFDDLFSKPFDIAMFSQPNLDNMGSAAMALNFLPKLKELVTGLYSYSRINFENGKITLESNGFLSKKMEEILRKYPDRKADLSLIQNYPSQINRSTPILDVDTGLYFDRATNLFGSEYNQTLEPRLFYLHVPYRSQYEIPIFDTANQSFNFDQLFQTNRFKGIDRIGDANQISVALISRMLNSDTGIQQSKFGIGRIYYMENRKVQLCNQNNCEDSLFGVGVISPKERLSPVVGFFNYALNANWNFNSNLTYDPTTHETNNGNLNLQFKPYLNHIINFGYNYVQYGDTYSPATPSPTDPKNNLNQLTTSISWPLTQKIDGLAAWNYNVSHQHFQTYLYGASYNTCCYALRLGISRTFYALNSDGTPRFNNHLLLQFILKGLGGVGKQDTFTTFVNNIPGYEEDLKTL